jgi:energy-coupling factor transport system permease protein
MNPIIPPSFPVLGGSGSMKWEGFIFGLVIVCRLSALFILFPVFTQTTSPESLALSLQALGLNYRAAFVITYTFSLIPLFREEALTVIDAQKLRNMRSFEKGFFPARVKALSGLVLPLVLGAMRKARNSSVAMDSRAFGVYKTRTMLEKPEMKTRDFLFIFGCIAFCACFLFWNY